TSPGAILAKVEPPERPKPEVRGTTLEGTRLPALTRVPTANPGRGRNVGRPTRRRQDVACRTAHAVAQPRSRDPARRTGHCRARSRPRERRESMAARAGDASCARHGGRGPGPPLLLLLPRPARDARGHAPAAPRRPTRARDAARAPWQHGETP